MSTVIAHVQTTHASRYLQQLCKHWGHKFPVEFTPQHGQIDMPGTTCVMDADAEVLTIHVTTDADKVERMQGVVAEHVQRFAFKEALTFDWATE